MSNHYHAVLRVKPKTTADWGHEEMAARWMQLFRGSPLVDRYMAGLCSTEAEQELAGKTIELWRERLFDLSWFMRCLNEGIAREANREDDCKGRFWEGRFKSQALLDERALLACMACMACMAYVDLNPIRAGLSETPEASDFTSVQDRMMAFAESRSGRNHPASAADATAADLRPKITADVSLAERGVKSSAGDPTWLGTSAPLAAFVGGGGEPTEIGLPFELADYLQLVDWTGHQWRSGKRGQLNPPFQRCWNAWTSTPPAGSIRCVGSVVVSTITSVLPRRCSGGGKPWGVAGCGASVPAAPCGMARMDLIHRR
jgi:hypothetical protein